jgi:16S rRNA (uracil1498-N3)-methyltransferase
MEVFFAHREDTHGKTLILRDDEYKHLSRVLRKKVGDHIWVTDGEDNMYEAIITSFDRTHAECEVVATKVRFNEPKTDVTLAVSLLRNPTRFDFVVEKATELGVRTIIPVLCEHTIPKREKHERLEKIALAAMKQCGRSYRPRILVLTSFETLVNHANDYSLRLIPHEKTEQSQFIGSVLQHDKKPASVLLAVGPEGGFSDEELRMAATNQFVPISLGPRRLRSETAALSAVSWVVGGW